MKHTSRIISLALCLILALTLFTCTYGGRSRVTVCCDKMVWTEQNQ
jgi:hypothetical protein